MPKAEAVLGGSDALQTAKENNKVRAEDSSVHEWYRFVLSYPPHLVRDYLGRTGAEPDGLVLDPFCGTGTTLVECKKLGIRSMGIEPNPMLCFASRVKVNWTVDPNGLFQHALKVADIASAKLQKEGLEEGHHLPLFRGSAQRKNLRLRTLAAETNDLLLANSISPLPLHRVLVLLEVLQQAGDDRFLDHEQLALARAIVHGASNLEFGPEVGVGSPKEDAPVVSLWLAGMRAIADDLKKVQGCSQVESIVQQGDARCPMNSIRPDSVDVIVTSPPYPNEKDYTRTTRLESVLLGFVQTKHDLRTLKQALLRSNTRVVFKGDRDDLFVAGHREIQRIADEIEQRRLDLGKTSGFERLYA
ncbi:MAG: DNA methyltransferase, partial [Terriglobales bacterium]